MLPRRTGTLEEQNRLEELARYAYTGKRQSIAAETLAATAPSGASLHERVLTSVCRHRPGLMPQIHSIPRMISDVSPTVFISYASEDATIAVHLAKELQKHGVDVWYDKGGVKPGDSIRDWIDDAILRSHFGILILSPAYFAKLEEKKWLWKELNALVAKEANGGKVIFPIWHNVDRDLVASHSLLLADLHAPTTNAGIPAAVGDLLRAMQVTTGARRATPFPPPAQQRPAAQRRTPRYRVVAISLLGIALTGATGVWLASRIPAEPRQTTPGNSSPAAAPSPSDDYMAPALSLDSATEHPDQPKRIRIETEPPGGGPQPAF